MNVYDTDKMVSMFAKRGYSQIDTPENADLVILNTCHIREKAAEKVYSDLGRIKKKHDRLHGRRKKIQIAVAGCVAQAEGEAIRQRVPYVDFVVGPQSLQRLPRMVQDNQRGVALEFVAEEKFDQLPEETVAGGSSAFLTIQEGCDKFCHFCVVPYTRGAEYSRPVADLYREAMQLTSKGAKELYLLGQNVNAYLGKTPDVQEWGLGRLIDHMATLKNVERIRYTTSHPRDVNDELITAHKNQQKLMPFLHLPVQSGSDNVLKAMNRQHGRDLYLDIVDKLKNARPNLQLSSDFIVGYPGETDADFKDTLKLVDEVGFTQSYSFKYSPRPGTPAANKDDVPEAVKAQRLEELQTLLATHQTKIHASYVGKTVPVLFEKKGKHAGQYVGRSDSFQSVYVASDQDITGQIKDVTIHESSYNSLQGELT